jgi:hypothetical protein
VGDDESKDEQLDRELGELLQELRVALPGVQVLLAFLLVAPLNQRFPQLSSGGKTAYLVSLICTVVATILLIAPSAHHRLRFRQGDKERILRRANLMMVTGLFFIGLAFNAALFMIVGFLYSTAAGTAVAAVSGALTLVVWYLLPYVTGRTMQAASPDGD